jgi:glyoxylase-like metal-dependent hydrolase (beta-lactamase superfamily II)
MKYLRWLGLVLFVATPPLAAAEQLFDIKPIVDGVYAAIAKDQYLVNCNAGIVLLEDGVLVVDTHSKPSAARALIDQIKMLTDKPVKYVVDTHFHWDHYQGNQAYPNAWPGGVEIISSEATRESIQLRGIPRVKHEILWVPGEIERLNADLAKATDGKQKADIEEDIRQAEAYLAELKTMQMTLPTLTFDRSLILHRPSRTVQVLWLGRAHTDGDVVVYLPKEKVIFTGDLIQGFTPFMGDSYPYDWIRTLEEVEKLDFDYVFGGHGEVMRGKDHLRLLKQYFRDLMAETTEAYAQGASKEEARKRVAPLLIEKYGTRISATFAKDVFGNIDKAYRVVSGSQD